MLCVYISQIPQFKSVSSLLDHMISNSTNRNIYNPKYSNDDQFELHLSNLSDKMISNFALMGTYECNQIMLDLGSKDSVLYAFKFFDTLPTLISKIFYSQENFLPAQLNLVKFLFKKVTIFVEIR